MSKSGAFWNRQITAVVSLWLAWIVFGFKDAMALLVLLLVVDYIRYAVWEFLTKE